MLSSQGLRQTLRRAMIRDGQTSLNSNLVLIVIALSSHSGHSKLVVVPVKPGRQMHVFFILLLPSAPAELFGPGP